MEKYRPSNGIEGEYFMGLWCSDCIHDKEMREEGAGGCEIIAESMMFDVDDDDYPAALVIDDDGRPKCTQYSRDEECEQPIRCVKTGDMFGV